MGDLLATSVSGLLAFQRALDVTSNNVANAATPGYSVERPVFTEAPALESAAGSIGNGVQVTTTTRSYDELLAQQVRSSQSSYSSFNTLSTQATQVDNLLSDSSSGLTTTLQNFANAVQNAADSPASTAQRQVLLSQAQSLAQQLNAYSNQLSQYGTSIESQIGNDVTQVNSLGSQIAALNQQITADIGGTAQTPNDLMDQRDHLIDQLSKYVNVTALTDSSGAMDVYVGSGQALVTGSTAQALQTFPDAYDPTQSDIGITSGSGRTDVTAAITGGELGGLLAARSQVLAPAQNGLGRLAVGIATLANQQQQAGIDLTGAQGQPLFAVGGVKTLPSSANSGSATLAVTRTPLSGLTTDDYVLRYSGASWQMTDATTGQSVALTGNGTAGSPLQAAGLSIVVTGSPVNGDSYRIEPTSGAASGFSVLLTQPSQIAAASLVQSAAGANNTGGASIAAQVVNPAAYTSGTYTITFTSATQYTLSGGSGPPVTGTYTSGSPISFNGTQVVITGSPATGDTFTVSPNTAANTGDNSNLLALASALGSTALQGGTTTLSGAANNLVSQIGVLTQQASAGASAQQAVNQDAVSARNNVSGVNLDEEAANLVRYQQAYQACAQMIQASSQMFDSLIGAVSRG